MKTKIINATILSTTLLLMISCQSTRIDVENKTTEITKKESINYKNFTLPGASVLAFGPNNVLFVGDSKSGTIHAISTVATELKDPVPFNITAIDQKIANKLETNTSELMLLDMKIHPISQEAYIAVKRGNGPDAKSLITIVRPQSGEIRLLDISKAEHSQVNVQQPVTETGNFWKDIPANSLTITDIDYHDGKIYTSGLTNGEFASTMRIIEYPFNGTQTQIGSIEMYHAVHIQNETRAPIRSMIFEDIEGESTLIASYTCTPLVTIPTSKIQADSHIKAKTIAELGFGNVPIDMITFTAQEMDGSFDKKLLITNKQRSASLISLKDLAKANKGEGLKGFTQGPEGVDIFPVPLSGVMHIDNQNQMMLAVLKRNMDTGNVNLLSPVIGGYLRLSDFISEFNFPDYEYSEQGKMFKDAHNMFKGLEGYPELVRE